MLLLVLSSVVEETPGVRHFQIIQVDPRTLHVRLETEVGADRIRTWKELHSRLDRYLAAQGVSSIKVELALEDPQRDPVSGKLRQVLVLSSAAK